MKKVVKVILIVIASIVLLGAIFGTVDYIRAKNGKKPIFIYRSVNIYDVGIYDENSLTITEYYSLGYKMIVCKKDCDKPVTMMPLYLGAYAWFIGADYITDFEVIKTEECDNNAQLYYNNGDINIYSYCLDKINVSKNNNKIELKEYLKTDSDAIDFIISEFTEELSSYYDGGTILYSGTDFNILKCHTLDGNNDIYIGTEDMSYINSFCK